MTTLGTGRILERRRPWKLSRNCRRVEEAGAERGWSFCLGQLRGKACPHSHSPLCQRNRGAKAGSKAQGRRAQVHAATRCTGFECGTASHANEKPEAHCPQAWQFRSTTPREEEPPTPRCGFQDPRSFGARNSSEAGVPCPTPIGHRAVQTCPQPKI